MSEGKGKDNPGKQPRRKPSVRKELVKIEAMAGLFDIVVERAEAGKINILPCRPMELDYFERCKDENNVAIMCSAGEGTNKWSVRGWHLNIATIDGFELTHNLTRKQCAVVYRFVEVKRDPKTRVVLSRVERTIIIAHTKDYRAIVAEMSKPAPKK